VDRLREEIRSIIEEDAAEARKHLGGRYLQSLFARTELLLQRLGPAGASLTAQFARIRTGEEHRRRYEELRRLNPRLSPERGIYEPIVDDVVGLLDALTKSSLLHDITEVEQRGHDVFIVHGTNHGVRDAVALFLKTVDIEPIILDLQPSRGRTIIEKFEANSNVGFAVVLMTGDDRGGPKDAPAESHLLRARQNVYFELGYFVAKLGRGNVCALHEEGVEIPSDYAGVIYIPIDSHGAWKYKIAQELETAGIAVNKDKLYRTQDAGRGKPRA
jgi:predicted nucleotide-binding protein